MSAEIVGSRRGSRVSRISGGGNGARGDRRGVVRELMARVWWARCVDMAEWAVASLDCRQYRVSTFDSQM